MGSSYKTVCQQAFKIRSVTLIKKIQLGFSYMDFRLYAQGEYMDFRLYAQGEYKQRTV